MVKEVWRNGAPAVHHCFTVKAKTSVHFVFRREPVLHPEMKQNSTRVRTSRRG
jgi:hypothetical protein